MAGCWPLEVGVDVSRLKLVVARPRNKVKNIPHGLSSVFVRLSKLLEEEVARSCKCDDSENSLQKVLSGEQLTTYFGAHRGK